RPPDAAPPHARRGARRGGAQPAPGGCVTAEPSAAAEQKPRLIFFHSRASGRCRRVEGFLAQVLQRRRNHETFRVYNVAQEERPDLLDRFGVEEVPTILVVDGGGISSRVVDPKGTRDIEDGLEPWLR